MAEKSISITVPENIKKGQITRVKVKVTHPTETGFRVDGKTKKKIPAHYVQLLEIFYGGEKVSYFEMSPGLTTNPYLAFNLLVDKAGSLKVVAHNNRKEVFFQETTIQLS